MKINLSKNSLFAPQPILVNILNFKLMGLFSFLKAAGAKLTGSKPAEAPKPSTSASENAMDALSDSIDKNRAAGLVAHVMSHGIHVENLDIVVEDDKATVYGQVETTSAKEKVILMVGNTEGIATVDDRLSVVADEPEATFYTVVSGDSLSKIAKTHYGDMMKYPVIFEANKPMLKSPDLIYPGQVLRIPAL